MNSVDLNSISPSVSVLIPTWRRPNELADCLAALRRQTMPAIQVVVTVRADDEVTHARLEQLERERSLPAGFQKVIVGVTPLTASMNAGLAATNGDFVALTDDDAEPGVDWLERCATVLAGQPDVGGVGGRDWQPYERWDRLEVGTVSWFGRVVGNHHLGCGPARDVELLKGVNACFRGELLRRIGFDMRLRGRGNVSHWEMGVCFTLRREGWRLIFDPSIAVDHHIATRHDGDVNARGGFDRDSYIDSVHNEALLILERLSPARRIAYRAWRLAIGTIATPGVFQVVRRHIRHGEPLISAWKRFRAAQMGMAMADRTFSRVER